jgi:hypothetical protein
MTASASGAVTPLDITAHNGGEPLLMVTARKSA